jgi:hypothetical protein
MISDPRSFSRNLAAAAVLAALAAPALAQPDMGEWLDGRLGRRQVTADYGASFYFRQDTDQPGRRLNMEEHDLRFSAPIVQDETREWSLSAGLRVLDLHTGARLPDTAETFPDALYDVRVGTTYRFRLRDSWLAGMNLTVGSPSDRPFHSADEWSVQAAGFLKVPHGEHGAWVFLLQYANQREFLPHVPLPGIAYSWRPSDRLHTIVGLPFASVRWKPADAVTLSGSYFIPRTVHLKAAWQCAPGTDLYLGFDWDHQTYFRAGRPDDDDRFFYYEKRVALGVRRELGRNVWVDVTGGYAFDRFFFEGEDYDERGDNRVDVADGPFAGVRVGLRF